MHLAGSLSLHIQHALRLTVKCTLALINQCKTSVDNFHLLVEQLCFIWSQSDTTHHPILTKLMTCTFWMLAVCTGEWLLAVIVFINNALPGTCSWGYICSYGGHVLCFLSCLTKCFLFFFPSLLGFTLIKLFFSFFTKTHFKQNYYKPVRVLMGKTTNP